MPTRNVVLTDHQEDFVTGLVESGRYQNASEALRAGLRLLERDEAEMAAFRERIMIGYRQVKSGKFAEGTGEEAMRRAFQRARDTWEAETAAEAKSA